MDPDLLPWRATVDVDLQDPLTDAQSAALISLLAEVQGDVSFGGKNDLRVKLTVRSTSVPAAVMDVQMLLGEALAKVGCSLMTMRGVKVRAHDKGPEA